jgi:hypothetical protein
MGLPALAPRPLYQLLGQIGPLDLALLHRLLHQVANFLRNMCLKGTLARDFLLLFFFQQKHPLGPLIHTLNSF